MNQKHIDVLVRICDYQIEAPCKRRRERLRKTLKVTIQKYLKEIIKKYKVLETN